MSDVNCGKPDGIRDLNIDPIPPYCREGESEKTSGTIGNQPFPESQRDVSSRDMSWLEDATLNKMGNGESALCDPMQTGHIINEQGMSPPNRDTVYRYSKSLRGTDEAMKKMFSDIVVEDDNGKVHDVPIFWGTQEKAVAYILQNNIKDENLVVDRIPLPHLAIYPSSYSFNQDRYTYHKAVDYIRRPHLNWKPGFTTNEKYERDTVFGVTRGIPIDAGYTLIAWTLYEEDMNQIMTQIMTKFSPMAYIRVKGIAWEIGVKQVSISSNVNIEPEEKNFRMFKYQFEFMAETYVSQPIVRKKAVLKTRIEMVDGVEDEDISEVLARLEQTVKELEQ